jgi:phage terminase large subunit GpA-like protein
VSWVIPAAYHLFENGENVCFGIPVADMAFDKWQQDFMPMIMATRYRDLLYDDGPGSRGGKFNAIRFRNGAWLRFLAASSRPKSIVSYTTRVLCATEVDGYSEAGRLSKETDPLALMESRTESYGEFAEIYLECTTSEESGKIWQEVGGGTSTRIVVGCPLCGCWGELDRDAQGEELGEAWEERKKTLTELYSGPELAPVGALPRGFLVGWEDGADEVAAALGAAWQCGVCGERFDDDARVRALEGAQAIHWGQVLDIRSGEISGEPVPTFTLSFRWCAAHNAFKTAAYLGSVMWKAARERDQLRAEKRVANVHWAMPPRPVVEDEELLTVAAVGQRATGWPRGLVPAWAELVTWGLDLGKYIFHYTATAWALDGTSLVIDYGVLETNAREIGEEAGFDLGFGMWADRLGMGWAKEGSAETVFAATGLVDSGRYASQAYKACRTWSKNTAAGGGLWFASKGYGQSQERDRYYRQPKSTGSVVVKLGDNYHWVKLAGSGVLLVEYNADHFKSWVHERLRTPDEVSGHMRLFGQDFEHVQFSNHLTAEQEILVKGIRQWQKVRGNNHFLDSTSLSCIAAATRGVRAVPMAREPRAQSGGTAAVRSGVSVPVAPAVTGRPSGRRIVRMGPRRILGRR